MYSKHLWNAFSSTFFAIVTIILSWVAVTISFLLELDFHKVAMQLGFTNISATTFALLTFSQHIFQVGLVTSSFVAFTVLAISPFRRVPQGYAVPAQIVLLTLGMIGLICICVLSEKDVKPHHPWEEGEAGLGMPWIYIVITVALSGWLLYQAYKNRDGNEDNFGVGFCLKEALLAIVAMIVMLIIINIVIFFARLGLLADWVSSFFDPIAQLPQTMSEDSHGIVKWILWLIASLPSLAIYLSPFFYAYIGLYYTSKWVHIQNCRKALGILFSLWSISIFVSKFPLGDFPQDFMVLTLGVSIGAVLLILCTCIYIR